jgi:hypothetical protein
MKSIRGGDPRAAPIASGPPRRGDIWHTHPLQKFANILTDCGKHVLDGQITGWGVVRLCLQDRPNPTLRGYTGAMPRAFHRERQTGKVTFADITRVIASELARSISCEHGKIPSRGDAVLVG